MSAHLVWDWNGTLLDDTELVVAATNAALAHLDGPTITVAEHRLGFHRPVIDYYSTLMGRQLSGGEFAELDLAFHQAYRARVGECRLADGAREAMLAWPGTQSLLSMYFHADLVPLVASLGLPALVRVDGLRDRVGGGGKSPYLRQHLVAMGRSAERTVLIGDSVDDGVAAREVGAQAVLWLGGIGDEQLLARTGWPVVSSLVEAVEVARELASTGLTADARSGVGQ